MSKNDFKKISIEVSSKDWKKLKILSIQKGISLSDHILDILEKSLSKKENQIEEVN